MRFVYIKALKIWSQMVYLMLGIGLWPVSSLNFGGDNATGVPPTQTLGDASPCPPRIDALGIGLHAVPCMKILVYMAP